MGFAKSISVTRPLFIFLIVLFLPGGLVFGKSKEKIPPIQEVYDQALKYARIETGTIRNWEKKVRRAPLLPRFQFQFDRRFRDNVNVNFKDTVSVNSTGVTVGPTTQTQAQDADDDLNFEIKAVWYLDQLLFSRDDLEISSEARALARERERILTRVQELYFHRFKTKEPLEREEITAALDALTGGWFSLQLQEGS